MEEAGGRVGKYIFVIDAVGHTPCPWIGNAEFRRNSIVTGCIGRRLAKFGSSDSGNGSGYFSCRLSARSQQ